MNLVKQEIQRELEKLGVKNPKLEKPPENIDADLSLPCFELAKEFKKSPVEVAKDLASKIKSKHLKDVNNLGINAEASIIGNKITNAQQTKVRSVDSRRGYSVKPLGPYLNFYLDWSSIGNFVLNEIFKKKQKYGSATANENIIMDVYQANPYKSFHIGHVRNAVLGESIRRILDFTGEKVTTVSYNGDVGVHVAKWLWYYNNFYKGEIPQKNFTKWAGQIYAESSKKIEENEKYKDEVNKINRKLDKRDSKLVDQWKKFRKLCYDDFEKIAQELQVKVDHNIPESECEEPGKELVKKLFKEKKLVQSEGAIGIDLKQSDLGFFILLKSDGTAIYSTKDFGLLQLKSKIGSFDKFFYVVGSEQDFYFKQLFKTYDLLGLSKVEHHHISHGLVTLKEGKMASRLGNVILYEDLRDEMIEMAMKQIEEKNPDLKSKEDVAKKVAFAAIKFQILNIENQKFIKFDWDQALDINGKSGPYIQYAYARARSILKKSVSGEKKFSATDLKDEREVKLLKKLSEFPETIEIASRDLQPYIVSNYVFDLATLFNEFYQSVPVLKAEGRFLSSRLALVDATSTVLKIGLGLLGIEALEEM